MEQVESGSAARENATPETVAQRKPAEEREEDAPSAKRFRTPTDERLPEDQEAMQPDSE